jgi:hypothetical protein
MHEVYINLKQIITLIFSANFTCNEVVLCEFKTRDMKTSELRASDRIVAMMSNTSISANTPNGSTLNPQLFEFNFDQAMCPLCENLLSAKTKSENCGESFKPMSNSKRRRNRLFKLRHFRKLAEITSVKQSLNLTGAKEACEPLANLVDLISEISIDEQL